MAWCHQATCHYMEQCWLRSMRPYDITGPQWVNTLRLRQNVPHFPDDIFKYIFLNENVWISIKISLKFVPKVPINDIPALVQIMAWRRPGNKPLYEPMMVSLLTHICFSWPQRVKIIPIHPWVIKVAIMEIDGEGSWSAGYAKLEILDLSWWNNLHILAHLYNCTENTVHRYDIQSHLSIWTIYCQCSVPLQPRMKYYTK